MRSTHPGWCDPRYCRFTDIDIQHRSTPTLLSTHDHEWWFTLARADAWAHPQQHADTELLIDVHNTMLRVPDVQHVLRAHEIESYASRLLTERYRAQFLGASVLHDGRPAAGGLRIPTSRPPTSTLPAAEHLAGRAARSATETS